MVLGNSAVISNAVRDLSEIKTVQKSNKEKGMATNGQTTQWDKEVDVIVVGYGAAGGISAITAHDAGAKVLLIEKMPHPGGISMLSGGGVASQCDVVPHVSRR